MLKQFISVCLFSIAISNTYADQYCVQSNCGFSNSKNGVEILKLHGSYYDMGQQYGALEKQKIISFHKALTKLINFHDPSVQALMQVFANVLPKRNHEIILGMSKTSGLSYNKLLEVTASTDFLYATNDQKKITSGFGCSAVEVAPEYTEKDYGTLVARNYDVPSQAFNTYSKYTAITVFNPNNGDNSVITISYIGSINAMSAINNKDLTSEINNGMLSVPGFVTDKPDVLINNFNALFKSSTLDDFNNYVKTK